jgi:Ran GTPase-activating protein (RanGAP) involved in mRNA processing and transport
MRQLQQLELSHNALGPQAAAALQQLLQNASQLRSFKLKHTGLQDAGGCAGRLK